MQYTFCTLFDKNYLTRGLALYSSLLQHAGDFRLWILCMDDTVYDILHRLDLERVTLIRLKDFEDPELLNIKSSRTPLEYCWTLTPSLPLYILEHNPQLETIAYLDADTFFFSSPQPMYDECKDHSVLIVKHNYSPLHKDKEKTSGIYNVEFLIFRNDTVGKEVLRWWRERCIEWCFFRHEDGKLGDQLYLNDWPQRFQHIRVLQHIGGGVAPWNIDHYAVTQRGNDVMVNNQPVIFYHYHSFRWYAEQSFEPSAGYSFSRLVRRCIYQPYHQALLAALKQVRSIVPDFQFGFHPKDGSFHGPLRRIVRFVEQYQFALYLIASALFLAALNVWIWPTSDEFLYGILAKMFAEAARGEMSFSDINTEHTWLVIFLSYVYNAIMQPESIVSSRAVIFPFALGTIFLLYKIPKVIGLESKYQMWWLWLLLLIPGFWLFSVRLMLEIPAVFSLTLLLYLLLKRAPVYYVGFAILLVLMTKEYYIYLTIPFIVVVYAFDTYCARGVQWWRNILIYLGRITVAFLPAFLMAVVLIDFNWLPYPRVLETSLERIFGDIFTIANKTTLSLVQHIIDVFRQLTPEVIAPVTTPAVTDVGVTELTDGVADRLADADASIIPTTPTSIESPFPTDLFVPPEVGASLPDLNTKISALGIDGYIPDGAYVPPSLVDYSFWQKIWLIYKYNLSETDIHILLLPLIALGAALRLKAFKFSWKTRYTEMRTDIIFFLFLLVFLYFNYYQAPEKHGFRITIPVIVSFIYFAFYGARTLLEEFSKRRAWWFFGLSSGAIALYWITLQDVEYGSILAHLSQVEFILNYKPYIFIVLFVLLTLLIVFFPKIRHQLKYRWLIVLVIGLFATKHVPFYINNRLETQTYGDQYGLKEATPILVQSTRHIGRVYSNTHPYRLQYYANDFRYSNMGFTPIVRRFEVTFPQLYFRFPLDEDFMYNVATDQIQFVLIVNDDYDETAVTAFETIRQQYPVTFIKLAEHSKNGRLQWILYEIGHLPEQL